MSTKSQSIWAVLDTMRRYSIGRLHDAGARCVAWDSACMSEPVKSYCTVHTVHTICNFIFSDIHSYLPCWQVVSKTIHNLMFFGNDAPNIKWASKYVPISILECRPSRGANKNKL
jgi:hypothetical protein